MRRGVGVQGVGSWIEDRIKKGSGVEWMNKLHYFFMSS